MTRCGGIVIEPGHSPQCPGEPASIGEWTYQGYGVVRVFDIVLCPVCGFVDEHRKVSETERPTPLFRNEVMRLQLAEKKRRDALIATARVAMP